jgi:outer membrane protein OmpA-like peptidoglycan-associated protein
VGDAEYNRNLSLQRAQAVREYLVKLGVGGERLFGNQQQLTNCD